MKTQSTEKQQGAVSHKLTAPYLICGETGIRTLGPASWSTVFETAPIDHSGISPRTFEGAKLLLFADMAKLIFLQQDKRLYNNILRTHILSSSLPHLRLHGVPTEPLRSPYGRSSVEDRCKDVGNARGCRGDSGDGWVMASCSAEFVKFSKAFCQVTIKCYFCS